LGRAEAGDQGEEGCDSDFHFDVDELNAIMGYDDVGFDFMRSNDNGACHMHHLTRTFR
jgi:hypothetical protein